MSAWQAGSHGTTFGGNPVACAAAVAVQEVFEKEHILENCREMGKRLMVGMLEMQKEYDFIGEVRGLGLMLALEIIKPDGKKTADGEKAFKILNLMLDKGLLGYMAGPTGNVVRLIPPLNISADQADKALEIMEVSMKNL
jgi:4-aminobutyrate aminotransferase